MGNFSNARTNDVHYLFYNMMFYNMILLSKDRSLVNYGLGKINAWSRVHVRSQPIISLGSTSSSYNYL